MWKVRCDRWCGALGSRPDESKPGVAVGTIASIWALVSICVCMQIQNMNCKCHRMAGIEDQLTYGRRSATNRLNIMQYCIESFQLWIIWYKPCVESLITHTIGFDSRLDSSNQLYGQLLKHYFWQQSWGTEWKHSLLALCDVWSNERSVRRGEQWPSIRFHDFDRAKI